MPSTPAASVAFAPPVPHPLSPLTGEEIIAAREIVFASGRAEVPNDLLLFAYVLAFHRADVEGSIPQASSARLDSGLGRFVRFCLAYAFLPNPGWGTVRNVSVLGLGRLIHSQIRDIITFPWIRNAAQSAERFAERGTIDLDDYPAVRRWHDEMSARPAVQRGLAVLADGRGQKPITETERENMFGATQFAAR